MEDAKSFNNIHAMRAVEAELNFPTPTKKLKIFDNIHAMGAFEAELSLPTPTKKLKIFGSIHAMGDSEVYKVNNTDIKDDFNLNPGELNRPRMDPEAKWLSEVHPIPTSKVAPEILQTYADMMMHMLDVTDIRSHLSGLNYVTYLSHLLTLGTGAFETILSGYLPGVLSIMFSQNFKWESFTPTLLDQLQEESRQMFEFCVDWGGCAYLRFICRSVSWWRSVCRRCIAELSCQARSTDNDKVLAFARRVTKNTKGLSDDVWYTAMYIGETTQILRQRWSTP